MIDEIKKLSDEIFNIINRENQKPSIKISVDRKESLIDVDNVKKNNPDFSGVLYWGINPSSRDIDNKGVKLVCYFWALIQNNIILEKICKEKGLIYNSYFSPGASMFAELGVKMLWQNKRYFEAIKKNALNQLKPVEGQEEAIEGMVKEYNISDGEGPYLIFTDLIQYKETNSRIINKIIKEQKLESKILDMMKKQIEYYNAKVAIVANAKTAELLIKMLDCNKGKDTKDYIKHLGISKKVEYNNFFFDYDGCRIYFCNMLSGRGQLRSDGKEKLKKAIEEYLKLQK
ncbi:MAG TPA: hypothetical protein PLB12_12400 [Candidatus Goldiibacteriota bacterium]|nr:hypothetical protein [Candidatus Goldiibacteriota bacterium]